MGITKTDFMRGMQCRKMLWLDKHKPDLKVIPPEIQKRLDAGNDFGDRAMAMFGEFEEMTVYRPGTTIPDMAIVTVQTYLMWYFGLVSIKQFARLRTHRKKKCRSLVPGSKHMGFLLLSHNGVRT